MYIFMTWSAKPSSFLKQVSFPWGTGWWHKTLCAGGVVILGTRPIRQADLPSTRVLPDSVAGEEVLTHASSGSSGHLFHLQSFNRIGKQTWPTQSIEFHGFVSKIKTDSYLLPWRDACPQWKQTSQLQNDIYSTSIKYFTPLFKALGTQQRKIPALAEQKLWKKR